MVCYSQIAVPKCAVFISAHLCELEVCRESVISLSQTLAVIMSCLMRLFNFRRRGVPASNTPIPELPGAQLKPPTSLDALTQGLDSMLLGIQPEQGFFALTLVGSTDFVSPDLLRAELSGLTGFAAMSRLEASAQSLTVEFPTAGDAALAITSHPAVVVRGQTFTVQYADPAESAQEPPRKKLKTEAEPVSVPKCKICYENLEGLYSTPCLSCKHAYCYECLGNMVSAALSDPERFPSRCCNRVLHFDTLNGVIPAADLDKYKLKFEEFSTVKPVYCAQPSCSKFLPSRLAPPDEHGLASCPQCSATTCTKCRTVVTTTDALHRCPKFDPNAYILKNFSYKTCPRCSAGVARMYGCPHMRCSCGAHWCWDCRRPIRLCWSRPCEGSRENGNETDDEWTPDREDLDEDSGSSTIVANGEDDTAERTTNEAQLTVNAGAVQNGIIATAVLDTATTHEVETAPDSAPATVAVTNGAAAPSTVAATVDVNEGWESEPVDLDSDSEGWEHSGLDFGGEPVDESTDMWGCLHHFDPLFASDMPKFWTTSACESESKQTSEVGTDEFRRDRQVTCLKCFKVVGADLKQNPTSVNDGDRDDKTRAEQVRPDTAVTLVQDDSHPTNQLVQSRRKAKRAQGKFSGMEACPFACNHCGVVYCFDCKKAENKKLSKALNRNIPIEAVR